MLIKIRVSDGFPLLSVACSNRSAIRAIAYFCEFRFFRAKLFSSEMPTRNQPLADHDSVFSLLITA